MFFSLKKTSIALTAMLGLSIFPSLELFAQASHSFDIKVENDKGILESYLKNQNTHDAWFSQARLDNLLNRDSKEEELSIKLIAEITPPEIDGIPLQAVSVSLDGSTAIVTYSIAGYSYGGALDLINLRKAESPELLSRVTFNDMDVTHVISANNILYATVCKEIDSTDPHSAFVVSLPIEKNSINKEAIDFIELEGNAATSLYKESNSQFYVTTGEKGALYSFKIRPKLSLEAKTFLDDARWVTKSETRKGKICVLQGTPGRVVILDLKEKSFEVEQIFDVKVPDNQAKSTLFPVGENLLVAGGTSGLQVVNIDSGKTLGSLDIPKVEGVAIEDHATNHAVFDKDLVFIANGGAGITVAKSSEELDKVSDKDIQFKILGTLTTDKISSINHVEVNNKTIVAAAGRGGVKIFEYKK